MNKNRYECDRCHKEVDGSEIKCIRYVHGFLEYETWADLCNNCVNNFHKKFMKMR